MERDNIDQPFDGATLWKIVKIAALTTIALVAIVVGMIFGWSAGWFE